MTIVVEHGAGETVMPGGFRLDRGSDAIRALEERHWMLPEADGGAGAVIDRVPAKGDSAIAVTTLKVPFVPLPDEPGRRTLT
ncbi:MAG TPA: hypothetical protein ENK23_07165, partial [Sorangium sp.]|nr:hypothetical protein [Sorangium sp.]